MKILKPILLSILLLPVSCSDEWTPQQIKEQIEICKTETTMSESQCKCATDELIAVFTRKEWTDYDDNLDDDGKDISNLRLTEEQKRKETIWHKKVSEICLK